MHGREDDEETRLLQQPEQPVPTNSLPWHQFWVVLFLQFSDPFALQTLYPFAPQLIRDIGVTYGDESQVGHYVGILQSSYYAAQALTVFHWSRLSDHIGRKPVILTALFAISGSMFSFGLSKTFFGLVISRIICGAFNASNGVIKSLVMDITDATTLPKAYGYLPLPFMFGTMIGPVVGGTLSQPSQRFPDIFGRSEFLKAYPYFLPCAVPATFVAVSWLVTYFCLEESVSTSTPLWESIKDRVLKQSHQKPGSLRNSLTSSGGVDFDQVPARPLPLRELLTPKVLIVTASYATMALVHVALQSILPIFYATPIELGGLSLDPPSIGVILSAASVFHASFQMFFYPRLHNRFGATAIYTAGVISGVPIVVLFPVINALARAYGVGLIVWLAIGLQLTVAVSLLMCYPCLALYIKAAAPNRASLGATNGISQFVVASGRIIGPASVASVFSYSMQAGHDPWSAYYFLMALVFLAVGISLLLPRDPALWEEDV